jgi:hypothetical protein
MMKAQIPVDSEYWRSSYYAQLISKATPAAFAHACITVIKGRDSRHDDFSGAVGNGLIKVASGFMKETDYLQQVIEDIETAYACPAPTGIEGIIAHIKPKNLIVLTGDNRQHNQIFANTLIRHCSLGLNAACGVCCAEPRELTAMLLALDAQLGIHKLRASDLHVDEWSKLTASIARLQETLLYLSKMPSSFKLLVDDLTNFFDRCYKECDCGEKSPFFILDLQRTLKAGDEPTSFKQALRQLRERAIETGLPVVLVHYTDNPDEIEAMMQFAEVVFSLESLSSDSDDSAKLIVSMSGNVLPSKTKLTFDQEMLAVQFFET